LGCPPICPLPPPQAKLSLRSLRVAPNAFKAAPKGPSASRAKVGAKVSYRLAVAASTRFTVERETAGRKKGRRCVPQTKRNKRAKRCKRYVALRGSFTRVGKVGSNSFKFSGRVRNKKLRPGKYRLVAVASAGGKKTKPARAGFKIVRR
jgi:hypothetical protein